VTSVVGGAASAGLTLAKLNNSASIVKTDIIRILLLADNMVQISL
jgi:hypothetical protein